MNDPANHLDTSQRTESTTSNMDNLQQKHEESGMCFCMDCHHNRMERILKETEQLRENRLILQNKNIQMKKEMEQSIQFATIQELKDEYDESTDKLVVITPKCHNVTFQVNEPNQPVNNQEKVAVINENCLLLDAQEPEFDQMKKDMRNKTVYITIEPQTEEMELTHYGHATIEEIPALMQEDKCKSNVEKYLLLEGLHIYYEIVWIYNIKIKNLLNQNGHSMNICWNKLLCSSLKEEPPESQTLGHFWDKNWMPLIKNEFLFII